MVLQELVKPSTKNDRSESSLQNLRGRNKLNFEALEPRTLLSATLFVTAPAIPADATHFQTLQAALMVAVSGDTVVLQSGFSQGSFVTTSLTTPASAGSTSIHTAAALGVGEVVSIGSLGSSDPLETALVTGVTLTGSGDYLITLATPLAFAHTGSTVDATNASTAGLTMGINKGITLTADPGVVLPFNLEIWQGTTGATLSNLNLTGKTLNIDGDGNRISSVTVDQLNLNNAHSNVVGNVTVNGKLTAFAGSSGNTVSDSTLASLGLNSGSHGNSFLHDTIGSTLAAGLLDTSGHDQFQNDTFTAGITINGNSTLPTADSFVNDTFNVSSGDALTLEHADGTMVQGSTFTDSSGFATAIVVHNSNAVVISGNSITITGMMGTGVYVYADGTGVDGVDINGNTIKTTTGSAIYIAKFDTTATMEVRAQANDLRGNAVGAYVFGDGDSAGNLDFGGGLTQFGTSTGMNNFSSFTAADGSHYAIGLFATSGVYIMRAAGNLFGVSDPMTVVADATHILAAFGSGAVVTTYMPPPVQETLAATAVNLAGVETGTTSGVIASFSTTVARSAGDFLVTIDWGDGTTTLGVVVANSSGGFNVMGSHGWSDAGTYAVKVSISTSAATITAQSTATVAARSIDVSGVSFTIDKKQIFNAVIATFTDNLPGTSASSYVASVAWSDGMTTIATIIKNSDGSFSIKTSRAFVAAGVMIASVSVATADGMFGGITNLTATITGKDDKVTCTPKSRNICRLIRLVKCTIHYYTPVRRPMMAFGHCHH